MIEKFPAASVNMMGDSEGLPIVIVPELYRSTGGVQVFSRRFVSALDSIYQTRLPVISINDRLEDLPSSFVKNRNVTTCGEVTSARRKITLMLAILRASTATSFLSTHPNVASWLRILGWIRQIPYLCVAHGIDVWNLSRLAAFGLKGAKVVLPVSRFTESRLRNQLGDSTPEMRVFANMVDERTFFPGILTRNWREELQINGSEKVILTIARLSQTEHRKGYDHILEAMPTLIKQIPDVIWILAGKGNDLGRVQAKAVELGVGDSCRFPGFIPDDTLPDLYRSSDIFVMPSKKEGFGIVFLEAMACGLPVIGGNQDGTVDALADGKLGRLIDPDDPAQLIEAIQSVLTESPPDARRLHQDCVDRFGSNAFEGRLRKILELHPALAGSRIPS